MHRITYTIGILLTLLYFSACVKDPEQVAVINMRFDTNVGLITIVETIENDTSIHLNTVISNFSPSEVNDYTFSLELDNSNGDFLVSSSLCDQSIVISSINVSEDYSYYCLFDGMYITEMDRYVDVSYEMLCE